MLWNEIYISASLLTLIAQVNTMHVKKVNPYQEQIICH